jgi:iron complex outermembrane receptor protein
MMRRRINFRGGGGGCRSPVAWVPIVVAGAVIGTNAAFAGDDKVHFEISGQSVGSALLDFAQQAHVPVLFPSGMFTDIKANPLRGDYSIDNALEILLQGTRIEAGVNESGQLVVRMLPGGGDDSQQLEDERMATEKNINMPRKLLASAIAVVFAGSGVGAALAQEQEAGGSVEEISVTGTRIRSASGFETPTPVTSISSAELKNFEPGNTVSQQLSSLPQFFNNRTSQQTTDGSRFSPASNTYTFLNLRSLGGNRTLVLLDGHRLQPSDKQGTVNPDLLPTALMRNVDVVTGGASAAYGADAVGGVVNFILDREFEGLKFDIGAGQHESGVGKQWQVGVAGGKSFFNDRLNLIASFENLEIDQIPGDRNSVDNFRRIGWVRNPAWAPGAPLGTPQRLTLPDVVSTLSTPTGLISAPNTPLNRMQFTLNGTAIEPFIAGSVTSLPGQTGGTSSTAGGPEAVKAYDAFDNSPSASQVTTRSWFLGLQYDLTDRLVLIADARAGRAESINDFVRGGFELESPWNMLIAPDNAFLPQQVSQLMTEYNIRELNVSKLGSYVDRPEVGSNGVTENVLTQWQGSAGFEYDIPGIEWTLEGHFQKGESKRSPEGINVIRQDRLYMAMDAVRDPASGRIVCRVQTVNPTLAQLKAAVAGRNSAIPLDPTKPPGVPGNTKPLESPVGLDNSISGCVPVNIFGSGNMTQEALNYVTSYKGADGILEQEFAEILLTGDLFEVPAGTVSFAAGATWREQAFYDFPVTNSAIGLNGLVVTMADLGPPINAPALGIRGIPAGIQTGSPNLHLFSTVPNIAGDTGVKEWFGEVQLPLWEFQGGQRIDSNIAFRRSDYDRSGASDSWKVGVDAIVHDDWRLRLTRSRDVREPTFQELFDAQGGGSSVNDPRFNNASVQTNTVSGGDPNLAPEVGNTLTAGIVWQPQSIEMLSDLQVALDWYDIKIEDRVDTLTAQRILDECARSTLFCDRINRDPVTNQLVNVRQSYMNLSQAAVAGTDLEVSWQTEFSLIGDQANTFQLRWLGAFLRESSTTPFNGTPRDIAGGLGTPEYSQVFTATYGIGRYSFQLQNRYVDSTTLNVDWVEGRDVDINKVSSMNWWNARIGYVGEFNSGSSWSVNFNIQNILDKEPPVVPSFSTRGGTQNFHNSFDVFGRRYNLSANYNF